MPSAPLAERRVTGIPAPRTSRAAIDAVPEVAARIVAADGADPAWDELAQAAGEANAFAEPWMLRAGMVYCDAAQSVKLARIPMDDGGLAGLFAVAPLRGFGALRLRGAGLWRHPNAFLAPALARAGDEAAAWTGLIDAVPGLVRDARFLEIDGLVEGGPLHRGLVTAAAALGLPLVVDARFERALIESDLDPDSYWDAAVRPKKRKELRRQWARLAEQGAISIDRLATDAPIEPWVAEFLALEASGWKGSNGSALASHADTRAFFAAAMAEGHARAQVAITALRLDGRAIAMLITLLSGRTGFSFKTAFDEDFARFSPGVLLQRESLDLLALHRLDRIDSCAAPDHPMIDSLWRERRAIVRLLLPLPGASNRLLFAAARIGQRLWHGAKALTRRNDQTKDIDTDG